MEQLDRFLYQLGGVPVLAPRFGEVEDEDKVRKFHALDIRRDPQCSPLAPGLFAGDNERFFHLEVGGQGGPYLSGVWLTGAFAGEVTFEVTDSRCLDISRQQQNTCKDIQECEQFVNYKENMEQPFVVPEDCSTGSSANEKTFLEQQKTCQGRWVAKAVLCSSPQTANVIKFSKDILAVMFLKSRDLILFKRLSDV